MIQQMFKQKYLLITFLLTVYITAANSQGNILVHPSRVVFENQKLKEDLMITNVGNDTATYVISFVNYKMQTDGSFKRLQTADSLTSADKFLRIFPRSIRLAPGQSQTIKLQCRKPSGLNDGEYRSHIFFRAERENAPLGMEKPKADNSEMSVRITAVFGISIPVFVRQGNAHSKMSISNAQLKHVTDSTSTLTFKLNRNGNASSYGDIKVDYVNSTTNIKDITVANGLGVYTEISDRLVTMNIKWPSNAKKNEGELRIRYMNADKTKNDIYCSEVFKLY